MISLNEFWKITEVMKGDFYYFTLFEKKLKEFEIEDIINYSSYLLALCDIKKFDKTLRLISLLEYRANKESENIEKEAYLKCMDFIFTKVIEGEETYSKALKFQNKTLLQYINNRYELFNLMTMIKGLTEIYNDKSRLLLNESQFIELVYDRINHNTNIKNELRKYRRSNNSEESKAGFEIDRILYPFLHEE